MSKKMVFKSNIVDEKIKRRAMKAVAGSGVDSIEVDMEEGKITAVGDVDPVCLAKKLRKLGYGAEILSVGPADEEKKDPVKEENQDAAEEAPPLVYVNPTSSFFSLGGYGYPSNIGVRAEYLDGCAILW